MALLMYTDLISVDELKTVALHKGPDSVLPTGTRGSSDEPAEPLRWRTAALLLSALLLCTALANIYKASRKTFWFDEIRTIPAAVDWESAVKFIGTDSNDLTMSAIRFLPLDVRPYREFVASQPRFLYSRAGDPWNWLPDRIRDDGYTSIPLPVHQDQALFMVERPAASKP